MAKGETSVPEASAASDSGGCGTTRDVTIIGCRGLGAAEGTEAATCATGRLNGWTGGGH